MPLTPQKYCAKCEKPNRLQARFCGHCGQPFSPAGLEHEGRSGKGKRKLPKSMLLPVVISAFVALLVYTNPTPNQYRAFVQQQLIGAAKTPEERFVASLFTPLLGWGIDAFTKRTNYYLWSVYTTRVDTAGGVKAIGILGTFIVVEKPQSFPPKSRSPADAFEKTQTESDYHL
jgi:predicted amidophosphoribosyltransferase